VTRYLLDTNLLIALAWPQHIHHAQAHTWFGATGRQAWATCPITQLGFVRISSNPKIIVHAVSPREAMATLERILAVSGHEFWSDDLPPTTAASFASLALVGHRQVTDAYLLALAQHHGGKLATFDQGVADLISTVKERSRHVAVIDIR
jgi:toxin-antitoxin system PIN domain toxin